MIEKDCMDITEAEAALYDRQIRLWGLDAQKRLRAAKVLLVGVGGLGAEVAKNIVLSGIRSLTLLDHSQVVEEDACSQFLVSRDDVGKNRAECSSQRTQQLNPMVEVTTDTSAISDKEEEFFTQYSVVCATCCSEQELHRINDICHRNKIMFFAGDVNGYYGYMFTDLNEHEYAEDVIQKSIKNGVEPSGDGEPPSKKQKPDVEDTKTVKKVITFSRLKSALSVDWSTETNKKKIKRTPSTYFIYLVLLEFRKKFGRDPAPKECEEDRKKLLELRDTVTEARNIDISTVPDDFVEHCFGQLSPVCAVTGGVLGQEIIKAVSRKDGPHNNFFFYNAVEGSGMVDCIA